MEKRTEAMKEKTAEDAPVYFDSHEASAWAHGYNAGVAASAPPASAHKDLVEELERMVRYYSPGETRPEALAKIKDARAALLKAKS